MLGIADAASFSSEGNASVAKQVRWGIAGAGRMAGDFVAAIRSVEGTGVTAIAARTSEAAADFACRHAVPAACAPYSPLWERDDVDVVYIATPNSTHPALATEALESGKHVLCEKPLASTGDQAARLFELAKAKGLVLAEAFMYRYHDQTKQILGVVLSGQIGEPVLVRGCYRFRLNDDCDIRLRPELQGGALWDLGVYPVDLARAVLGEPLRTFGSGRYGTTEVDRSFVGMLEFPANRIASFDCSFDLPLRRSAEIVGTEGSIDIDNAFMPLAGHFVVHAAERSVDVVCTTQNPYAEEVRAVVDAIRSSRHQAPVGDDAVGNARAVAGLCEAAGTGAWTTLAPITTMFSAATPHLPSDDRGRV